MSNFNIASVVMRIIADEPYQFTTLESFTADDNIPAHMTVYTRLCACINEPKSNVLIDEGIKWVRASDSSGGISLYICNEGTEELVFKVDINESWDEATIYYLKNKLNGEYAFAGPVGEILFRNLLLFLQGICIHASALICEGKGVIFSAPSGTGKSTQAEMWKALKNAQIINGDRAALRMSGQVPLVFGTPWSGSSGVFSNSSASLKAIVVLEQSSSNEIHRLNNTDAVSMLLPRCFLPYFDNELMSLAIKNISRIIASTPVYLLKCKPDSEAVELVYQCLI